MNLSQCSCLMKCQHCMVCIHMVKCTCRDFKTCFNLCVHIHAAINYTKNAPNSEQQAALCENSTSPVCVNEPAESSPPNWIPSPVKRNDSELLCTKIDVLSEILSNLKENICQINDEQIIKIESKIDELIEVTSSENFVATKDDIQSKKRHFTKQIDFQPKKKKVLQVTEPKYFNCLEVSVLTTNKTLLWLSTEVLFCFFEKIKSNFNNLDYFLLHAPQVLKNGLVSLETSRFEKKFTFFPLNFGNHWTLIVN